MIWATVNSSSYFCWLYRTSPFSTAKNMINLVSELTIWWCSHVELSLELLERVFAMTIVFSWQNSVSLHPFSFCTPRLFLPVILGISWIPTFAFQSPMIKRTFFFFFFLNINSRRHRSFHRTAQLQLLWHQWLGHRLGLLWCCMVYLLINDLEPLFYIHSDHLCILVSELSVSSFNNEIKFKVLFWAISCLL